jgi:hypothetical protein
MEITIDSTTADEALAPASGSRKRSWIDQSIHQRTPLIDFGNSDQSTN